MLNFSSKSYPIKGIERGLAPNLWVLIIGSVSHKGNWKYKGPSCSQIRWVKYPIKGIESKSGFPSSYGNNVLVSHKGNWKKD